MPHLVHDLSPARDGGASLALFFLRAPDARREGGLPAAPLGALLALAPGARPCAREVEGAEASERVLARLRSGRFGGQQARPLAPVRRHVGRRAAVAVGGAAAEVEAARANTRVAT